MTTLNNNTVNSANRAQAGGAINANLAGKFKDGQISAQDLSELKSKMMDVANDSKGNKLELMNDLYQNAQVQYSKEASLGRRFLDAIGIK